MIFEIYGIYSNKKFKMESGVMHIWKVVCEWHRVRSANTIYEWTLINLNANAETRNLNRIEQKVQKQGRGGDALSKDYPGCMFCHFVHALFQNVHLYRGNTIIEMHIICLHFFFRYTYVIGDDG